MIRYNFVFKNLKRVAASIVANNHIKGEKCYWLMPSSEGAVIIVPYQFITGGTLKELE
jgi:hypothetical protein